MKKIKIMFLVAVLVFTMIPQTVSAVSREDSTEVSSGVVLASATIRRTALELGGKSESNEAEGWSWNADERVLTLNNTTIIADASYALDMPSGTIVLKGENTIKSICDDEWVVGAGGAAVSGIRCYNGSLIIEGSGSLTAIGGASKGASYGIYASKGHITINGGEIFAQGGASERSHGIGHFLSKVTINGGSVVAKGGQATGSNASSYGITSSSFIMTGGTLTAIAGSVPASRAESSRGIHAVYDIDIRGVTVVKPTDGTVGKKDILDSNGNVAQEVIIQGKSPLKSPVISLTTDTSIPAGTKTSVIWEPVEGAFRYYLNVIDKTTGIYDEKDRILNFDQTSYEMAVDGGHTYEIFVKSVGPNGNESAPSNTITLVVGDFISDITKISLQNADTTTRKFIQGRLYDVLFRAQFRPDINTVTGDTTDFGVYGDGVSQREVNSAWPAKNGGGLKYKIEDKVLGTVNIGGGAGCNAYGRFVAKYIYGTVGSAKEKINSEKSLIDMIHRYADPGEWIRMKGHVIVFLGETQDGKGFYFADYSDNSGTSPQIRVGTYTYSEFWKDRKDIYIVDTNGGSYYSGTASGAESIQNKNNNVDKVSVKIDAPAEAIVTLENEALDSRYPGIASFGSVSQDNERTTFTLNYREDYEFNIKGIEDGNITVCLNYYNGTNLLDTRSLVDVPVSENTSIYASGFDAGADFILSIDEDGDGIEDSAWGVKENEIVYTADQQYDSVQQKNETMTPSFYDVTTDAYYYNAVQRAVVQGITNGTSDTAFSPETTCTRAQVVTFLWRAAGSPKPSNNGTAFTDVAMGSYYYDAVSWAIEKGITNGTSETTFSPNQGCTRGQVVTFIHRYENTPKADSTKNPFTDVKSASYYYDAVLWAVGKSITNGTSANTFGPDATCTRGQIVTFLYRDLA